MIPQNTSQKDRVIKVALIGWYGQGAHGDDVMQIATKNIFKKVAHSINVSIDWSEIEDSDIVVVGGGTILGIDSMGLYKMLKGGTTYFS